MSMLFGGDTTNGAAGGSSLAGQQAGKDAAKLSDPFSGFRGQFAQMLSDSFGQNGGMKKPGEGMADKNLLSTDKLKFDPQAIQNDPAYQFQKQGGDDAILASSNANGGLNSGGTLAALSKYNSGVNSQFTEQQFDRNLKTFGANEQAFAGLNQAQNQENNQQTNYQKMLEDLAGATPGNATAAGSNIVQGFQAGTQSQAEQNKADSSNSAGWGKLIGTAASLIFLSDERVKKDITLVGQTKGGSNIYSYKYKWGGPTMLGVLAQEEEKKNPKAVKEHESGYKVVDYSEVH